MPLTLDHDRRAEPNPAMLPAPPGMKGIGLAVLVLAVGACGDPPTPVREGHLQGAGDARIHYRVLGSGPDTVVVVHGGPGAGIGSVAPDLAPLARDLTVIFYDQRGGGRSTLPADTSRLHARYFVEDLEAVRRHFRLDRLKLVSHSFGAIVVARYARRYPDRIDRWVLHGATPPVRARAAVRAGSRRRAPSPDTTLSNRADALLRALLDGTAADPVAACREYETLGRRLAERRGETVTWSGTTCDMPMEAVRYYYRFTAQHAPRTFGDWDFSSGLDSLMAPVLVVWGTRDSLAIPDQRAWANAVPNGRLLLIEGAGKAAVSDAPGRVLPAVSRFLRGDGPEASPVPAS